MGDIRTAYIPRDSINSYRLFRSVSSTSETLILLQLARACILVEIEARVSHVV